jgi:hypothetical protein
MKIVSGILVLVTVFFSFKHGWAALTMKHDESGMMKQLGINKPVLYIIGSLTLAVGVLVLFPATFFAGCLLNAILIVLMLILQLKAGNLKAALIEIPFLLMPLIMIYLGHPLKDNI